MVRRSTWIVVIVFALLLAGAFWQRQRQANAPATATPTGSAPDVILFPDYASITALRVDHAGGQTIAAARDAQGQWQLQQPPAPTNSAALEAAVNQLGQLMPQSSLLNPPTLQAMGLDAPAYRLQADYSDGRQIQMSVGKQSPVGNAYYVLLNGKDIYVVSSYGLEMVLTLADNPPVAATPTADATPAGAPAPAPSADPNP
jgi:hypothetical protein